MKICIFPILMSGYLLTTGCMTTPAMPEPQRPQHWGQPIHQNHNFHQINVVINLRSRDQDSFVLSNENFQLHHVPIHTWAIDREDLLKIMLLIQQAQQNHQKVLLHCYHGSDRTGASVAMYRIIFEHWPIEQALQEMKHGGYGFHAIWSNIEKLFTPENVKWIREQLTNPSTETLINTKN